MTSPTPTARQTNSTSSPAAADEATRFWSKVVKTSTCWLWTAAQNGAGYGYFRTGSTKDGSRRNVLAHRWAFEAANGRSPKGQVDHLCRVRHCVRPSHLDDVTQRENLLRGQTIPAAHAAKKECPRCGANYRYRRDGRRYCSPCSNRGSSSE